MVHSPSKNSAVPGFEDLSGGVNLCCLDVASNVALFSRESIVVCSDRSAPECFAEPLTVVADRLRVFAQGFQDHS